MARADELLALLDDPERPAPERAHPTDEVLLVLLAHVAASDGVLQEEELAFLRRLRPRTPVEELERWARDIAATDLDLIELARRLPDDAERWGALRFAAAVAWSDRYLDTYEKILLVHLADALELPEDAVERVLEQVIGVPHADVAADRVVAAMRMAWTAARFEPEALTGPLAEVLPGDAHELGRLVVGGDERVGITDRGLVASFQGSSRFLRWGDIMRYNRVPVFGAAVRIETRDGTTLRLVDHRLREVGTLLDRVYSAAAL